MAPARICSLPTTSAPGQGTGAHASGENQRRERDRRSPEQRSRGNFAGEAVGPCDPEKEDRRRRGEAQGGCRARRGPGAVGDHPKKNRQDCRDQEVRAKEMDEKRRDRGQRISETRLAVFHSRQGGDGRRESAEEDRGKEKTAAAGEGPAKDVAL